MACSQSTSSEESTSADVSTTASADSDSDTQSQSADDADADSQTATTQVSDTPIEDAEISSDEAVNLVKEFSAEQLGLDGEIDDYRFMVSTQGRTFDGKDYMEVIACFVTESEDEDDESVSIDTIGTYYVSYDGTQVFTMDSATGDLTELTK